ncbi:DUF1656 domain-containing protein [Mesorhizobium sp. BAC0120]|uniref:DUF1656 domain-containing protein n=1 Tax=Mesorhizobium sp. BAC0120 TaxID=3090670 RepID=UPI00298C949E|nr:DUF1656 domain-containing protein [Mesorhizobium sp. BAC0120]MDW6020145.1 DUF1656 domain-containing protein [Mesorhizobium sp. BAC0120]
MRFTEIDILGVYISPMVPMLLGAWLLLVVLRRVDDHFLLLSRRIWHPALFWFAIFLMLLSSIVLLVAARAG